MLEVKNISVDHGKLRAVWDVSMHVESGERVGLLGANGAGKSTTIGAFIGLYKTVTGSVTYNGEQFLNATTAQTVKKGIALVPEGRRLFPQMTVMENLKMGAFATPSRHDLDAVLDPVHLLFPILKQKSQQRAGELSGGQQQMVAIGRALMSRPKLLLLDEPFIGVAPQLVDQILESLTEISLTGVTMILVEQNTHRALEFVQRAYVLENGRTVLHGTRDQLLDDQAFAAKFLGLD